MRTTGQQQQLENQRRVCRERRQFPKENQAIDYLIRRRAGGQLSGGRVYKCDYCTKYHVTTTPPRLEPAPLQ